MKDEKIIALTFDDGPTATTKEVLDILEKYNVVATFFLIGENINNDTIPTMQRELDLGCEIENHSYNHADMSKMDVDEIKKQIEKTSLAIKNAVGVDAKFFRPPYILTSDAMFENIDLPFIVGMGCGDWDNAVSAEQRINTILNDVKDGMIILLHDFQGNVNTVQALPLIIEGLKAQGYSFVTLEKLFKEKGVNPNQKCKMWINVLD